LVQSISQYWTAIAGSDRSVSKKNIENEPPLVPCGHYEFNRHFELSKSPSNVQRLMDIVFKESSRLWMLNIHRRYYCIF
jgi:hypothetical protein